MSRNTSKPKSSLIVKILVVVSLFAFVAAAQTSEAPSDGPLTQIPIHQGQIAGGVRDRK